MKLNPYHAANTGKTVNTVYVGTREPDGSPYVTADGRALDWKPTLKLRNHSPDGPEWGYGGSGPAQLALALLMHATKSNVHTSCSLYQRFKWAVVSNWGKDGWCITRSAILRWIGEQPLPSELPDEPNDGGGI